MDVLNLKHDGGTKNANSFYHKGRLKKKVVHLYFWLKTWKSWFSAFFRWFFFAFLEVFLKVSFDPKSLKPWEWRIIIILGLDKSQNPKLVLKNKNAHKKNPKKWRRRITSFWGGNFERPYLPKYLADFPQLLQRHRPNKYLEVSTLQIEWMHQKKIILAKKKNFFFGPFFLKKVAPPWRPPYCARDPKFLVK